MGGGERCRCSACGNRTRFDVYERRRTRSYYHFSLGGDLKVDEQEVLSREVEQVICRWCGRSDAVETVPPGGDAAPEADSAEGAPAG